MQRLISAALIAGLILVESPAVNASSIGIRTANAAGRHRAVAGNWAATATQAMNPVSATDLGVVPDAMPMKIVVGLKAHTKSAELLAHHIYTPGDPLYGQFITPQYYLANFAPSNANVSAVVSYLQAAGFTNVAASGNNMTVRAQASASVVENAFNTEIDSFVQNGTAIYANVTPAQVPASLSGVVTSVLGLQNVAMHLDIRHKGEKFGRKRMATTASSPCAISISDNVPCVVSSFYSNDFRTFYDAQSTDTGALTKEAVFTEGDVSDIVPGLQQNQAQNNLPSFPVKIVPVDLQSSDTYGQGEFTMDTQISTGFAHQVKMLTLYNTGSLNDSDTTLAFNMWVTQDKSEVANASFGECEYEAELDGAMPLDDQIFQEGLLQGQTLFASSGDSGSACGFNIVTNGLGPLGPPNVNYPATSPYVMGAGGTTLIPNSDGTYYGEISWYSGGGGISLFEPPEFWTYQAVAFQCIPEYCSIAGPGLPAAVTGGATRAVPDVAMDADAELSAANYFENGSQTANGGTSLAAPLSTGAYAMVISKFGKHYGAAGPVYYGSYIANGGGTAKGTPPVSGAITNTFGGFHDILVGSNGAYTALPGYDLNTGMGTVDVHKMLTTL